MSHRLEVAITDKLLARRDDQLLRQLHVIHSSIDFCSNDYLGLAKDQRVSAAISEAVHRTSDRVLNGSTGSRLISGNSAAIESLEAEIADFHNAQSALVFSTGFAANTGLFECIVGEGDTLITDRLIHASTIDGARLSKARRMRFRHNDTDDLEAKLLQASGSIVIAVESVYSMDGDRAPLQEIVELAERFGAAVVVDEAHSVGMIGRSGAGLVVELGLEDRIFARLCTFGKALGLHGASVLGSRTLREYLINFARPFIYSTAPSPYSIECIRAVYRILPEFDELRSRLRRRIQYFRERVETSHLTWLDSDTPIQSVIVPGNVEVRRLAACLRAANFGVVPIVAPTVPKGIERIRFCVHAFNTCEEIDRLFHAMEEGNPQWPAMSSQA